MQPQVPGILLKDLPKHGLDDVARGSQRMFADLRAKTDAPIKAAMDRLSPDLDGLTELQRKQISYGRIDQNYGGNAAFDPKTGIITFFDF